MDVSIIVPVGPVRSNLEACLAGIAAQEYDAGRIEVFLCGYGGARQPAALTSGDVRWLDVRASGPYAARNAGASRATGEILVFTETGCTPEPAWIAEHAACLADAEASISVGRVVPDRPTRLTDLFYSYEDTRDTYVFSSSAWQNYFGRPKNMAVSRRRFLTHGPFLDVQRGADSAFVQKVAREVGCGEIAFSPKSSVRQLSIRGILGCFSDRFRHGHALQKHGSSHAAPIPFEERRRLFRETVERQSYGPLSAWTLSALLIAGILVFRAGKSTGNAVRSAAH
jgi:hypothetical protein